MLPCAKAFATEQTQNTLGYSTTTQKHLFVPSGVSKHLKFFGIPMCKSPCYANEVCAFLVLLVQLLWTIPNGENMYRTHDTTERACGSTHCLSAKATFPFSFSFKTYAYPQCSVSWHLFKHFRIRLVISFALEMSTEQYNNNCWHWCWARTTRGSRKGALGFYWRQMWKLLILILIYCWSWFTVELPVALRAPFCWSLISLVIWISNSRRTFTFSGKVYWRRRY